MRPLKEIIVHCTATRPDWWATRTTNQKVAEVRRWHVEDRGWKDIGYHFLIDRDGTVATGRPLAQVGAHVEGHNTGTIGISLFGGHGGSANDPFEKNFTPEQDTALRDLIDKLQKDYPSIIKVSGHNDYANKSCPTFDVAVWYGSKKPRTNPVQSTTLQAAAGVAIGGGAVVADNMKVISSLNDTSQIILTVVGVAIILAAGWIARERIKYWLRGVR